MIQMLLFVILCFITGFSMISLISKKQKLSNLLFLSLPIGIVVHTIIFILLAFISIYYNKYMFIIISIISTVILFKNRITIEKDLKRIPIYYILFICYIIFKLLIMASTGYFEFYNYDEFTAYQTNSTILYLSHDFSNIFSFYAPINYFIGVMSLEFVGISLTAARIFSVIFFGLMSLEIYSSLINKKVNIHISALISMIFLISSSEILQLSKSFYNNIFFMFYFSVGIYGLIDHFIIQEDKKIPWLSILMCIGALLTRREAIYYIIFILLITSVIAFMKKLINKKELLMMNSLIIFPMIWKVVEKIHGYHFGTENVENQVSLIEKLSRCLELSNLKSYLNNWWNQTFGLDYYYLNTLIYVIFIVTILSIIISMILKKKNKKYNKYIWASIIILFFEFAYIGIVVLTQIFIFTLNEYLVAASFSRYVGSIAAINFIILGILLFHDTQLESNNFEHKEKDEIKKIKNSKKILLIIPAYNEEENIRKTCQSIFDYNTKNQTNYDIIVINDGSTDHTQEILEQNHIPHINLINNLGIGGAVQTGYQYALENNYDIAIQYDGDGQHDINYVKDLIQPILDEQADLTIGSRFLNKETSNFQSTWIRRVGIHFISFLIKICTGKKITDTTSGFRAANQKVISLFAANYPMDSPEPASFVVIAKKGYRVQEIAVSMKEREGGISSITNHFWKPIYYMINVSLSILITSLKNRRNY